MRHITHHNDVNNYRGTDDKLISYTWPGGYPVYYLDTENNVLCPACANKDGMSTDPIAADVNWEDASLYCDDCSQRIESAYAEVFDTQPADD